MVLMNLKLPSARRSLLQGKSSTARSSQKALRPTKKEIQRTRLLATAYELFSQRGFDVVRLEDIAARADVSAQTLYNYFHSKRDLLIATFIYCREQEAASYERILAAPSPDPCEAIAVLMFTNAQIIRSAKDKQLWREIFSAVALAHDRKQDEFDHSYCSLGTYIRQLLEHFVQRGTLATDYPVDVATDVIVALSAQNLRSLVSSATCTPEHVREKARLQLRMLWPAMRGGIERQLAARTRKIGITSAR